MGSGSEVWELCLGIRSENGIWEWSGNGVWEWGLGVVWEWDLGIMSGNYVWE